MECGQERWWCEGPVIVQRVTWEELPGTRDGHGLSEASTGLAMCGAMTNRGALTSATCVNGRR